MDGCRVEGRLRLSDPAASLGYAGMVIAIGFVADYFFRRTGIPDLIFLVLLGFLMGPILKVVDPASLVGIAPLFSALAITIILFDGGLNLELYKVFEQSLRASLLAVVSLSSRWGSRPSSRCWSSAGSP